MLRLPNISHYLIIWSLELANHVPLILVWSYKSYGAQHRLPKVEFEFR
jgi:hypothetical protein